MPSEREKGSSNRLGSEISPYLLQHAENPVCWQPWDAAALSEAARRDCPIFLSIGYASCHWCHVMAHESFEDPDIAEALNSHFVSIKVDREERPDLDDVYMAATQLTTGRGGWPNSVWLTPDGRPWFAGTYFPPRDRNGALGFRTLTDRLADIWRDRRADVERQADALAAAVRRAVFGDGAAAGALRADAFAAALRQLCSEFDEAHGGFGTAPKFPPHTELQWLLAVGRERPAERQSVMIARTLDALARGGIRDVIGGGFHRYSTDERWRLPHFEKMLTDNAELLAIYADAAAWLDRPDYAAVARDTGRWLLREMEAPEGGFCAGLDADSPGGEGAFYTWTAEQLREALGADADAAMRWYGAAPAGNFADEASGRASGANVLSFADATAPADALERCRARLFAARAQRPRPARDEKIVAAWNGRAIGALSRAAARLDEPEFLRAAERAALFILRHMRPQGRWRRVFARGRVATPAFLDDHAHLGLGFLNLAEATGAPRWKEAAVEIAEELLRRFADADGGFRLAPADRPPPVANPLPVFDHVLPSANAAAIELLTRLGDTADRPDFTAAANRALAAVGGAVSRFPRGALGLLRAAELRRSGAGSFTCE